MIGSVVLVGYLSAETLNGFKGAPLFFPVSSILVRSLHLPPIVAALVLAGILGAIIASFVNWASKHPFWFIKTFLKSAPRTQAKRPQPEAPKLQMKAEDLQLGADGGTQQFVEVFPLEGSPLNVYAAITKEEGREGNKYVVIEPTLAEPEKETLENLKKLLIAELDV
jgi:hypothetical protein